VWQFPVQIALLVVILLSVWAIGAVLYQLIKQQGRLLLRLDDLENRLFPGYTAAKRGSAGLALGTQIRAFRLPDLDENVVGLDDCKGAHVLLIHWSADCGFCHVVAPTLARLEHDLAKRDVRTLFLCRGDAQSNRKMADTYGLKAPMLLLKGDVIALEVFGELGTPVAYLLDELGRVAEPLAVGGEAVVALAQRAAGQRQRKAAAALPGLRPLSESRLERNGLKAGTVAPLFTLPDVYGRTVSLEAYRGRQVLLLFTNPSCSPCDELAPHLVELQRRHRHNGLALIMVGRGEPEENRRKADLHGFDFPVVVQPGWKLSKEYGIFTAPVAFLIDENGRIAQNVATGVNQILAIAAMQMTGGRIS
jgi:peroxiredoxin